MSADVVQAMSETYGPILSWRAVVDEKTTADCAFMNGKNFSVLDPPTMGLPGAVHPFCRCEAGKPIEGAELVAGSARVPDRAVQQEEPTPQPRQPDFTPDEQELFTQVAGRDLPSDPQEAREMLANGDFESADQDALIALDDKLIAASELPDAVEAAGLDRDKFLGQFDTLHDAAVWAEDKDSDYLGSIPDDQRRALVAYKRDDSGSINQALRRAGGGQIEVLPDHIRDTVSKLDRAFERAPQTDRPVVLFRRGVPPGVDRAFADFNEAGLLGQVFGDSGYTSTTLNKDWKSQAVGGRGEIHMVLPEGSRSLSMEGLTDLKGAPEYEVLLPRDLRYRVTKVGRNQRGAPIIDVEVLAGDG